MALQRLLIAFAGLSLITLVGTVGYWALGADSWFDALYMTVITMSTVGYREVVALGPLGKLFTVGLILTSVGFVLYFLSTMSEILVEGRLRELFRGTAMEHRIDNISDHVVVCGYGRFGRVVVEDLLRHRVPLVILERDPARQAALERLGEPYVLDSALSDEALEHAGVPRARAIVIATGSDADNVFIALSAREQNPQLRIHARGESDEALRRLRLAGADQVVSAYQMGGQRVAASILQPAVVDFLEISRPRYGQAVDLEELRVHGDSSLVGRTVGWLERETPRVRVVALKRGEHPIELIPSDDTSIQAEDHLVLIGDSDNLKGLAARAEP